MMTDMLVAFSHGPASNTTLVPKNMTWAEFVQRMMSPRVGDKDGSYLIRGGALRKPERGDENLEEAAVLVVDGDSGFDPETGEVHTAIDPYTGKRKSSAPTIEEAAAAMDKLGYPYVLHTTHSYVPGVINKWRLYTPATMRNERELAAAVDLIISQLHGAGCYVEANKESYVWSQAWYLPRCREELIGEFKSYSRQEGKHLDVAAAVAIASNREQADAQIERAQAPQPPRQHDGDSIIEAFNQSASFGWVRQQLEAAGYKFAGKRGDRMRFIAPSSETGMPGVNVFKGGRGDIVTYSHHGAHDRLSHRLTDAFGLYTLFQHGGDPKAAVKALAQEAGTGSTRDPLAGFEEEAVDFRKARQEAASTAVNAGPKQAIGVLSFVDLLEDEEQDAPDYIDPDFLGPGNFCLIAGPPKAQKSFLLTEMLVACATGGRFLGDQFRVSKPLRVFYLQAEMNRKLLKRRAKMMSFLADGERQLLRENLAVTERLTMILDEAGVAQVIEAINTRFPQGVDIIAIDPLANLFDGDNEDKAAEIMRFLTQRLEAIRRATNPQAALILVHHSTKKTTEDMARDPFIAIRGSGALRGYYDTGIIIYRKSEDGPERKIHFELRNGDSPEPMTVKLSSAGRLVPVDQAADGITRSMAQLVLDEIAAAWKAGKPLSTAPQTRSEGRHVGRAMAIKHGLSAASVERLVEQWMVNGIVSVEIFDKHTKARGLKVIGTINSEVQ